MNIINTPAKSLVIRRALQLYANPANIIHQKVQNKRPLDANGIPMAFKTPPRPGEGTVVVPKAKEQPHAEINNVGWNVQPNWDPPPEQVYPKRFNSWPAIGI